MSLRARLTALTFLVTVVGIAVVGVLSWQLLGRTLTSGEDDQLTHALATRVPGCMLAAGTAQQVKRCASADRPPPPPGAPEPADPPATSASQAVQLPPGGWLRAYDAQGSTLVTLRSAASDFQVKDAPAVPASRLRAAAHGQPTTLRVDGREVRVLARRGASGMLVAAVLPTDRVTSTLASLEHALLIAGGIVAALALVLSALVVSGGLRGLRDMAARADGVAHDEHSMQRWESGSGPAELRSLAGALNSMLDRVDGLLDQRRTSEARLTRFVADASHELRTPVTAIRGHAQLLVREPERIAGDDRTATLRRIDDQARRLGELVDDLLDLARVDEGASDRVRGEVEVHELLQACVDDAAARDAERVFEMEGGQPAVALADCAQLRQLLDNLLANASTHTPPGTMVRARVQVVGDEIVVVVRDDGPGLPAGSFANATERFWRAPQTRAAGTPGTGLGLALVRAIAERHGGSVDLAAAAGGGLRVEVRLPAVG